MLSNVTEYDVIVDAIRPHIDEGQMDDDMTDAFLYAFERTSGLLVPRQVNHFQQKRLHCGISRVLLGKDSDTNLISATNSPKSEVITNGPTS